MLEDKTDAPGHGSRRIIGALLFASAIGYLILALWFPLIPNIELTPPGDIRTFAPSPLAGLVYASLLIILFTLFVAACRSAEWRGLGRRPLVSILAGALALALPLLWTYPVNATDIFGYVIRGRIASAYGENPFSTPAAALVGDPFMPLVGEWAGETTPYGPLWEILAAGLTAICGDSLLVGVMLFKALGFICFLITGALIWNLLPSKGRILHTTLWAWNPGLLLTFVMNGHNDAVMLMWLVLGYWFGRRGRPVVGLLIMVLAILTKPIAVLVVPLFFLGFMRELPDGRERARVAALSAAGAVVLAWLVFLPWAGEGGALRAPIDLTMRLVREATGGAGFSPAVWVYMALGRQVSIDTIGTVAQISFLLFCLGLAWLGFRGRSPLRGAADILYGYLVGALNFRIWYAAWPFPWLVLDDGLTAAEETGEARSASYRLRVGLWFLLTSQLSVLLYGHLRVFAFGGDQALAHLVGVPFVFGLPWLLALRSPQLSRPLHTA